MKDCEHLSSLDGKLRVKTRCRTCPGRFEKKGVSVVPEVEPGCRQLVDGGHLTAQTEVRFGAKKNVDDAHRNIDQTTEYKSNVYLFCTNVLNCSGSSLIIRLASS